MSDPIKAALREAAMSSCAAADHRMACPCRRNGEAVLCRIHERAAAAAVAAFLRALPDALPLPAGAVLRDDGTPLMRQVLDHLAAAVSLAVKDAPHD
jgi:hypothetical protein